MIFNFSATGNSAFIAHHLLQKDEKIFLIEECLQQQILTFSLKQGESVGFIFPVYFMGIPKIVIDFLEKVKFQGEENLYFYVVLAYGGKPGGAGYLFSQLLEKYTQRKLNAIFGVLLIDNYLPIFTLPSEKQQQKIMANSVKKIQEIQVQIRTRQNVKTISFGFLDRLITWAFYRFYKKARLTKKFKVADSCINCQKCANECPEQAIEMKDGKPNWIKTECSLCLRCLHHCPKAAIDFGWGTKNKKRFTKFENK